MEGVSIQRKIWETEDVEIEIRAIESGPFSMEFATEEVLAGPWVLKLAKQAEREGFDAIVLDCMVDPVLRAARETVSIPVMGPAQSGLAVASTLGKRIAVIGMHNGQQHLEEHIRAYGFEQMVVSMHTIDVPPADLVQTKPECVPLIEKEIEHAIRVHRADVILFGCTVMSGYVNKLTKYPGLPIVEPMSCAINMAQAMVRMKLAHSKLCYESLPPRNESPGSIPIP
jgi:allantoin racemase